MRIETALDLTIRVHICQINLNRYNRLVKTTQSKLHTRRLLHQLTGEIDLFKIETIRIFHISILQTQRMILLYVVDIVISMLYLSQIAHIEIILLTLDSGTWEINSPSIRG